MQRKAIVAALALAAVGLTHAVSAQSLSCSVSDTTNPHTYGLFSSVGVATTQGQTGGGIGVVFSTNGIPTGCDQLGSDGDNEQGLAAAQMPIAGATCPYSQDIANENAGGGAVTIGHHGYDIYATNVGNVDVTWSSGVDGYDAASDTNAVGSCVGNGVVSDSATTDPNDCSDSTGANVNLFGHVHEDTHPLSVGPNDPASGFTCFDAVDGNEWTFLNVGPYVGLTFNGPSLVYIGNPLKDAPCVDLAYTGGPVEDLGCLVGVNLGWTPTAPSFNGQVGISIPIAGLIASEVEPDGD